jgi:hypothetical protein
MPRTVCQMVFRVKGDASGNGRSRGSHRAGSDQSRASHQAGSSQTQGDVEPTAWTGVGGGGPLGALGLDGQRAGERQYGTLETETTYITDHTHDN